MQRVDNLLGRLTDLLLIISGIMILLMAFAQTYGVVQRYILKAPDSSPYEISVLCLLFCGILAVSGVEKLNQHIMNDIISSRYPARMKVIVIDIVFPLLALIFCVVLTWKSMDNALYALKIGQVTQSSWALPLGLIKLSIPICYILLCLVILNKVIHGIMVSMHDRNKGNTDKS